MLASSFLSEFPPVNTEAWEQAIRHDLKGADYAARLITHTPEGIDIKPYYRSEDLAGLEFLNAAPSDFPYVRGARAAAGWRIREEIDAVDPEEANSAARCAVAAGAEEIAFCRAAIADPSDLGILLANLSEIPIHFEGADQSTIRLLSERVAKRPHGVPVSAALDWSTDLDFSAQLIATAPPNLVPFTIRAEDFQDQGATAVEEVGFALASGVDFIAAMQERGLSPDRTACTILFSFAMGPDFFMQIAKLRAFRIVWAEALESFGAAHAKARIHARTSGWNRTVYDARVNVLRATTEAISAAWGGADSIHVAPFDDCYKAPGEASRRLARNTQIILKQEALFSRVADPAGGSYYLESLTDSIARKAWTLLPQIESMGGYRAAVASGFIAQQLQQRTASQQKAVASRRRVLVGANRFANASESALDKIDASLSHGPHRAAEPFEQLRLRTERHAIQTGKTPRILLAEIGDPENARRPFQLRRRFPRLRRLPNSHPAFRVGVRNRRNPRGPHRPLQL